MIFLVDITQDNTGYKSYEAPIDDKTTIALTNRSLLCPSWKPFGDCISVNDN